MTVNFKFFEELLLVGMAFDISVETEMSEKYKCLKVFSSRIKEIKYVTDPSVIIGVYSSNCGIDKYSYFTCVCVNSVDCSIPEDMIIKKIPALEYISVIKSFVVDKDEIYKFVYSGMLSKQGYEISDRIGELEFIKVLEGCSGYKCYEVCVPIIKKNKD